MSKEVNVIEIGPGIGSLTQYLLEEAAEVMAFEIDKSLIPILEETMAPYDNFTLVSEDILKVDLLSEIQKFKNQIYQLKWLRICPTTSLLRF